MAGRGGGGCGGRSLFTLLMHMLGPSRLLLYSDFFHTSGCRNLDISNPTVFAGPVGSYFGFSVDFFRKDDGSVSLVVGAPKANTSQPGITEGGAVFLCPWSSGGGQCQVLSFDSTGDKTYLDEAQQTLQTNKSHQWFGASVRSEQSHIVACAPLYRWNVIKANDESGSTEVGSCRLARMQGQKSEIAEFSPCRSEYTNKYYTDRGNYGDRRYCEVGFSVDLTKDGKIVMGAPGGYFFMGQVIVAEVTTIFKESNQSLTQSLSREAQTYEDRSSSYDGYQGYSVAVGEFTGDSIPDYVAGIPHDRDASGTVKIYMGTSYNMLNWVHSFFGKQVSSYFGHSVAATDINGDGTDDIFIGAPLFMDRRKDKKLHEVGQVYLYLQKENNGFSQKPDQILTGWDLYGRFGSAIAPLGDIDQDGYDDIAVGAPFSGGDGRVYIFNGQSDGVDPQYSQVLESPFRRLPSATGFGFALRGGSDVDSNSYPDLIVGAWGASKVAVYRSRTVLSAEAHIALHPDVINPDVKTCAQPHSSQLVSCFDITVCISLQGKKIPPRIVLNAELQLDRMKQRMMRRTLFVSSRQSQGHFQLTLGRDKPSVCTNFSAYLRDESEFKDKLSPILVSLSYSLDNSSSTDPEAPPAFFQGQTTAHIQTRIILDCGPDNVCVPDLKLSAEIHKESFYIGDEDPVLITVTARNEGEGAYETELHVRPPPQIHYQGVLMNREGFSMPICSQRKENGSTVVVCELSNPMKHNEQLHAGLYFSAGNLEQAEGSVVFELQLRSKNSHNPNSEAVQLKVKVSAAAVVTVRGSSSPVEYVLPIVNWQPKPHPATLEDIGPPVEHVYELHNLGPGTVNGKLSLEFPSRSHGNFLLYVFANASEENFRCLTDSPDVDVYKVAKPLTSQNDSSDDKPHLINKREVQETQSLTQGPTVVNCTTTNCMRFICVMTNLEKGRSAVVKVLSRLWVQSFLERPFEDYILQSKAEYRVTSMPYKVQPTVFPSGTAETQTGVVWVTPDNAKEVPVWWIIVAVIGGLILLALLIYIFWKVGFFKRTRPPQDDNEELSPDDTANSVYADMQSKTD